MHPDPEGNMISERMLKVVSSDREGVIKILYLSLQLKKHVIARKDEDLTANEGWATVAAGSTSSIFRVLIKSSLSNFIMCCCHCPPAPRAQSSTRELDWGSLRWNTGLMNCRLGSFLSFDDLCLKEE